MTEKKRFPKTYILPDGKAYSVSFLDVIADIKYTVYQFEDLSAGCKESTIASYTEESAEEWINDYWSISEIIVWGKQTGEVDVEVIRSTLLEALNSAINEGVDAGHYEV